MDTNLGAIELTDKQVTNLNSLKTENIKGFSYWHDSKDVVVVSDTPVDVEALRAAISALPDVYPYEYFKANFSFKVFSGMLNNVLSNESIVKLGNHMRTLEGYCEWKNFVPSDLGNEKNAQSFVNYLESEGIATALEAGAIRAAFQYQGITI